MRSDMRAPDPPLAFLARPLQDCVYATLPDMAELKTKKTEASVDEHLDSISDESIRNDCREIAKMMKKATGAKGRMWGPSIVGFGDYSYKYASGRTGDWFLSGFSPRKSNISLYLMCGFDHDPTLLGKLGKFTTGKSCLYIKRLADVDKTTLQKIIDSGVKKLRTA